MAKTTLPTNYVDDVLNGAMDGKRRYREIPNADGTISLEDATTYDQIGNNFGASQLNLMNDNINQSFDANKMLKTMDEVNAVTQEGYGVDALVVKELNSSLSVVESKLSNIDKILVIKGTLSGATGYTDVTVLDESIRGKATVISVMCSDGDEIATNGTVIVKIHPQTGLVRINNPVPQFVGYPYVLLLAVTK